MMISLNKQLCITGGDIQENENSKSSHSRYHIQQLHFRPSAWLRRFQRRMEIPRRQD